MLLGPGPCQWRFNMNPCLTYAVAKESGAPTGEHSTKALNRTDRGKCLHVAPVEARIDLATAFNQIERSDRSVSQALSSAVSKYRIRSIYRDIHRPSCHRKCKLHNTWGSTARSCPSCSERSCSRHRTLELLPWQIHLLSALRRQ